MGPSHVRLDHDGVYAFLDMGQGIEARLRVCPSPTHLLVSDRKTGSTAQKGETFVTSSSLVKRAELLSKRTGAHIPFLMLMNSMTQIPSSNSTTTTLVTRSRTRSKMKIVGRLSGSLLARSSISLQRGRACRIPSLGSLGSGLRSLKSS